MHEPRLQTPNKCFCIFNRQIATQTCSVFHQKKHIEMEPDVALVRHLSVHHKALVCALRSDERGLIRAAFTEVVLTSSMPPCWISVIDWMLQLIGLIWYITTSLETWSDDRQQIQLLCFNPKFMNLFSSPSSWISVSSLVRTICIYMIEVRERRRVRPSARITLYIISLFQCSHMWGLICFIISISPETFSLIHNLQCSKNTIITFWFMNKSYKNIICLSKWFLCPWADTVNTERCLLFVFRCLLNRQTAAETSADSRNTSAESFQHSENIFPVSSLCGFLKLFSMLCVLVSSGLCCHLI